MNDEKKKVNVTPGDMFMTSGSAPSLHVIIAPHNSEEDCDVFLAMRFSVEQSGNVRAFGLQTSQVTFLEATIKRGYTKYMPVEDAVTLQEKR